MNVITASAQLAALRIYVAFCLRPCWQCCI